MITLLLGAVLLATPPVEPTRAVLEARALAAVDAAFDSTRGGWVDGRRLPSEAAIELGLWRGRDGDGVARARAFATLEFVMTLRDTVGGGFVRSGADVGVAEATLDKPATVQAARLELLLAAHELTGDALWRDEAAAVADHMDRVLLDPRHGFNADQIAGASIVPWVNARATAAWLHWAAATADARPRDFATRTLDRVMGERFDPQIGILQWSAFGEVESVPRLMDQVETARALLVSSRVAARPGDLALAVALADSVLTRYEEPGKGLRASWSPSGRGVRRRVIRGPENARAARLFAELSVAAGAPRFAAACERIAFAFAKDIGKGGLADADWALALRSLREPWLPAAPRAWEVETARPQSPRMRTYRRRR